jgi:hypothetical protein
LLNFEISSSYFIFFQYSYNRQCDLRRDLSGHLIYLYVTKKKRVLLLTFNYNSHLNATINLMSAHIYVHLGQLLLMINERIESSQE